MSRDLVIVRVAGIPAPQGSKRYIGGGRVIEMSKAVGPWREAIRGETQRAMNGRAPFGGAVEVRVNFFLPRPKAHYGSGRNAGIVRASAPLLPAVLPDLDKLARAVLDGLTAGGAWKDDGQVTSLLATKWYAGGPRGPGCHIEVTEA